MAREEIIQRNGASHKGYGGIRLDEHFCKRVEILPSGDKRPSDRLQTREKRIKQIAKAYYGGKIKRKY